MEIIKKGEYPIENIRECEDCHCVFKYYNEEIITDTSSVLESDVFGGFGIHRYIKCPQCNHICTISCDFYEDISIFKEIADWFKNIFKKGEKNNGKN